MTDVMLAAPGIPGGLPALPNSTMRVQLHNGVKPPPSGFFRSLTGLALSWSLIEDGHVMDASTPPANAGKFRDPAITADGQPRATVPLSRPETLWFNTGTLCNITCANCYIESSPLNDRLVYITEAEMRDFLDQLETRRWPVREIGFTGGEPFMNPEMIAMARTALERGFEVLILTNAMRPMMRPHVQRGLADLAATWRDSLTLRISLDHWSQQYHDAERGEGAFARTLEGMAWLRDTGLRMTVAGRSTWGETDAEARAGYRRLYAEHGFLIDADDPAQTVIFPEMDEIRRGARNHHRLLGHPRQIPRRCDVRLLAHGGETARRGAPGGALLHAAALRARIRDGRNPGRGRIRRRPQPPPLRQVLRARRGQLLWLIRLPRRAPCPIYPE